jgi:hypothetical protein
MNYTLQIAPVILGKGEHLLGGLDVLALGYTCSKNVRYRACHSLCVGQALRRTIPGHPHQPCVCSEVIRAHTMASTVYQQRCFKDARSKPTCP